MWNHLCQTKPSIKLESIALYFLDCRKMLIQLRKREQQDCTWLIQSPEFFQFYYHRLSFITFWIFTYNCTVMPASSYISTPLVSRQRNLSNLVIYVSASREPHFPHCQKTYSCSTRVMARHLQAIFFG